MIYLSIIPKKNKINYKRVEFKYKDNKIKKDQTLKDFINKDKKEFNQNQTLENIDINNNIETETKIIIEVIDLPFLSYCFRAYKLLIFIILALIIVAGVTILIVLLLRKDSDSDKGSKPEIPNDYFIKAIYNSSTNENVQLISNEYDLNKIKSMSIDGDISNPVKSYTFKENGEHTIYISFNYLSKNSLSHEGRWLFNGITNLIKVEFSNLSENYPDVSFQGMFNNCINLRTCDFSQINLNYNFIADNNTREIYEYYNSMDYMFNNCKSLTLINFDIKMLNDVKMNIISSKFMFNNCISLKNIYLNKITFHQNLNNMFSNCISLENLYLSVFISNGGYLNMSYIFYNCSSLASLNFPSENLRIPNDMSYSFAYCTSLKKFDLVFDTENGYDYSVYRTMSNVFRNCTSLISINLKFPLIFDDMSYAFMGCHSLYSLENGNFYIYPSVKYMNGMFLDCYEFSNGDFTSISSAELIDISYMLSGTRIAFVDFSAFNTKNIINYQGLFYGCETLSSLDISSFTHNNLPDANLSIFKGKYPSNPTIFINNEFLSRIIVPSNFDLIIYNGTKSSSLSSDIISKHLNENNY